MPVRSPGSRACSFPTCSWLSDYAGPVGNSRLRFRQCCLPVRSTRSAPDIRFSKLNSRPVGASVYTSPGTSRHPAQDSRSRWFATPFLWGSFIPDCTPVYPGDRPVRGTRRLSSTLVARRAMGHSLCGRGSTTALPRPPKRSNWPEAALISTEPRPQEAVK